MMENQKRRPKGLRFNLQMIYKTEFKKEYRSWGKTWNDSNMAYQSMEHNGKWGDKVRDRQRERRKKRLNLNIELYFMTWLLTCWKCTVCSSFLFSTYQDNTIFKIPSVKSGQTCRRKLHQISFPHYSWGSPREIKICASIQQNEV